MGSPRPNILFILTDQQRSDTIAALGNPVIRTPAFDRLVREGTSFTSAYCSSAVCVSSRCGMYFGQYSATTDCTDNGDVMPWGRRETFMAALTKAGYRTHAIGKLHFTPDADALGGLESREAQEELRGDPEKDDYLRFLRGSGFDHITDPHGVRGEMYYVPQPAQMPSRAHPTNWVGDRGEAFIKDAGAAKKPWMLITSFIHPHPPFAPPAPWHKLYRAPLMPLPLVPQDSHTLKVWINLHQNRYKYRDQGIDNNLLRCMKAYYYACISFIDFQVGRLLKALEDAGTLDNTLIVATSDHGELLGDYHCFGKRSYHDAASRVPLLARFPGRYAANKRHDAPVSLVDLYPTFTAAAGIEPPAGLDGVDLHAQTTGGSPSREAVFIQINRAAGGLYTAVSERWKYVYSAPDQRELLFDRRRDPDETRDLIGNPLTRDAHRTLREALVAYAGKSAKNDAVQDGKWRVWPRRELPANPDAGLLVQDHAWADTRIPGYTDLN